MPEDTNKPNALTPGEVAVGLSFNPSAYTEVDEIKRLMARVFDIVERSVPSVPEDSTNEGYRKRKMRDAALHEVVTAQMWAVKVVTLKL